MPASDDEILETMNPTMRDCYSAKGVCLNCNSSPYKFGWTTLVSQGCRVKYTSRMRRELGITEKAPPITYADPNANRPTPIKDWTCHYCQATFTEQTWYAKYCPEHRWMGKYRRDICAKCKKLAPMTPRSRHCVYCTGRRLEGA